MIIIYAVFLATARAIQGIWETVLLGIQADRATGAMLEWARFVVEEYREVRDD